MDERLYLFTDGASRGNPGPAGAGAILKDQKGSVLRAGSQYLGQLTNNEAEYHALLLGLKMAREFKPECLICCLDSELVVYQLTGRYRVRKSHLGLLLAKVRREEQKFQKVIYKAIPREKNEAADRLANVALRGK